jgi:hypothetical protein
MDDEVFEIRDSNQAAYAADRILTERERLARIRAACAAQIADADRAVARTEAFYLPALETWAAANPPRKGKTIHLPTGALSFRAVPGGPRLVDPEAALSWARQNKPDLIVVRESVRITDLKAWIEASGGELPDGVEVVEARETFDVKGA